MRKKKSQFFLQGWRKRTSSRGGGKILPGEMLVLVEKGQTWKKSEGGRRLEWEEDIRERHCCEEWSEHDEFDQFRRETNHEALGCWSTQQKDQGREGTLGKRKEEKVERLGGLAK